MKGRRNAFTIIELLVVISIVTLLVSILLPSLSSARRQARSTVCLTNLKRLGMGMILYVGTNRDRFPPFRLKESRPGLGETFVNQFGRKKPRWQWFLDKNEVGPVIDPEPFLDEIESQGAFGDSSIGEAGESGLRMTNKYFLCPSLNDQYESDVRNGAYGYNYQYLGNSRRDKDEGQWDYFPVGMARIQTGGRTVLLADSRGAGRVHGKHSYSLDPPRLAVERDAMRFGPGSSDVPEGLDQSTYAFSPVEMRHGDRGNVVFVDGHAEAMTLADLGYELDEKGVAVPIVDPLGGTYSASNKLWNGEGTDMIARERRP